MIVTLLGYVGAPVNAALNISRHFLFFFTCIHLTVKYSFLCVIVCAPRRENPPDGKNIDVLGESFIFSHGFYVLGRVEDASRDQTK